MNTLVYKYGYEYILYVACLLHPVHIITAYKYGYIKCCIACICLMITSINYWRYPVKNSYRRFIDIGVAVSTISYHIYISPSIIHKSIFIIGSSMYIINTVFYIYNKILLSIFSIVYFILLLVWVQSIYTLPQLKMNKICTLFK